MYQWSAVESVHLITRIMDLRIGPCKIVWLVIESARCGEKLYVEEARLRNIDSVIGGYYRLQLLRGSGEKI